MDAFSLSLISSKSVYFPIHLRFKVSSFKTKRKPPNQYSTPAKRSAEHVITIASADQPPPPRASPTLKLDILSGLEGIINRFIDRPIGPWVDPKTVLSGNFAPVDELEPTECEDIEGVLPPCLEGAYIRNGSNPQLTPHGPYHIFDGDGMLHCLRISNHGSATFCSRYVQTYKYLYEQETGMNLVPNFMGDFQSLVPSIARVLIYITRMQECKYNRSNGMGTANTNLTLLGGRLFALGESDLPYEIKVTPTGDIETIGRCSFDGKLSLAMTAHPKADANTAETFAFRNTLIPAILSYFWFDAEGNKQPDLHIPWMKNGPSFLHDFAITKSYAIFPDIQLGMDLLGFLTGSGSLAAADSKKVSRMGVIRRYAKDSKDMRWYEVPGFNMFHITNAWDETDDKGDEYIVLIAPNVSPVSQMLRATDSVSSPMDKVKINIRTGKYSRNPLSTRNVELATINPAYIGKKNKYVYAGIVDPAPKISGVVKLDLTKAGSDQWDCTVATRMYDTESYGSEPFFVARDPENKEVEEDDGYLVSYVHNEETGESKFIVMDAKSPSLEIVASIKLPQRVPYGFHGLFIREKDLRT
ncbi:carotenoid cleavage dioxygenase 4 [Dionaea muscipula]